MNNVTIISYLKIRKKPKCGLLEILQNDWIYCCSLLDINGPTEGQRGKKFNYQRRPNVCVLRFNNCASKCTEYRRMLTGSSQKLRNNLQWSSGSSSRALWRPYGPVCWFPSQMDDNSQKSSPERSGDSVSVHANAPDVSFAPWSQMTNRWEKWRQNAWVKLGTPARIAALRRPHRLCPASLE